MKTLGEIAEYVGGKLEGDPKKKIEGCSSLEEAGPDEISFVASPRYASLLARSRAGAVLLSGVPPGGLSIPYILVADASAAFAKLVAWMYPEPRPAPGVHPLAVVSRGVRLGKDVTVGPLAVIEEGACVGDRTVIGAQCYLGAGVQIGADCRLFPLVTVMDRCRLGDRVVVHSGAVIGSDGFGYFQEGERHVKIPQRGNVEIGEDVEIGANTTIDRARIATTRIGAGTKIDNLVQIAHNVKIGRNCLICGASGLSGSVELGDGVILAGGVGVKDHVKIGDGAVVLARSGVGEDIPAGAVFMGFPAVERMRFWRREAALRRLPEIVSDLAKIKKKLGIE